MKQTAVDWLIKKLYSHSPHIDILDVASLNGYWEQAKEMEKDQIKKAYLDSSRETCDSYGDNPPHDDPKFAELYYKNTYGQL